MNAQDGRGQTPLYHACSHERWENVGMLLADPRVEIEVRTKEGKTPYDALSIFGDSVPGEVVKAFKGHPGFRQGGFCLIQ